LDDSKKRNGSPRPAVQVQAEGTAGYVSDEAATEGLEQNEHVDGHTNAVMRVRKVAWGTDCNEAENKNDSCEADGEDL